jgi:hypothetical protein
MRHVRLAALLGGACLVFFASALRALTVDELMEVRNITDPQLSPDGRWVAFAVEARDSTGRAWNGDVWIAGVTGGKPRRLTREAAFDGFPRWCPDASPRLAFRSTLPPPPRR